ncbi:MAG: glutamine-hydrolyzing GMP synthase [Patescibacteria group bacterium]|nr:glutamine-hydrolyzing GMP synthase [Patescibacteria group bacterium]
MASLPQVLIIELGSQYTLLIERTLRELGVRSAILAPAHALAWLKKNPVRAVILSGGSSSVYDNDAPQPPKDLLSLVHEDGQPIAVLGICYGMQWLSQTLGGKVQAVLGNREYGETKIELTRASHPFFASTPREQTVWMSHGDSVISLPEGFNVLAYSDAGTIAAMQNGSVWGVQFHPEVVHTPHGKTMLANFLQFALCEKDWTPPSVVTSIQEGVGARLGNERVIFGFSGGVDSTTVSAMLAPVLKEKLLAVTIDGGQLREGELDEIRQHAGAANVSLRIMDARREFQEAMTNFVHVAEKWTWPVKLCVRLLNVLARHIAGYKGVVDAEEKRRRFREVYTSLLVRAAHDFGAHALLQGTLAPDRIESGATGGAMIKSHHNVGLRLGNLLELHPVDHLFKYEVRALAREIGLPERIWRRQPFPGPGLFLRVVGVPATPEKLDIVRWADARVREITERHGVYNTLSQLVVAYIGVNTVGVKGDGRAYGGAIVVRAVETTDFMTARGVHFSEALEDEISRVLTRSPAIVRVWYDPTNKPPATTEFE